MAAKINDREYNAPQKQQKILPVFSGQAAEKSYDLLGNIINLILPDARKQRQTQTGFRQ